jgi:5'-AMP-activated protein kinase catalytic alpha subunit
MPEVLKAFTQLDIGWKKTGAYNIKCRWVAPGPSSIDAAPTIDGLTDLPMAQSMPRLSSSGWAGDSYGGPNSVTTKNKDNEAGIRSNLVKFEVQLYKMREDKYMLDLQRIEGSYFLFLDICTSLLSELHVP